MTTTASPVRDTDLHLVVERGAAGCALVVLRGELDLFTGPALSRSMDELIASGRTMITLDLSELTFLDCSGHRVLRTVAEDAERVGGEVRLAGCSRSVRHFLDLMAEVAMAEHGPRGVDPGREMLVGQSH